jgi:hypothetical protein
LGIQRGGQRIGAVGGEGGVLGKREGDWKRGFYLLFFIGPCLLTSNACYKWEIIIVALRESAACLYVGKRGIGERE